MVERVGRIFSNKFILIPLLQGREKVNGHTEKKVKILLATYQKRIIASKHCPYTLNDNPQAPQAALGKKNHGSYILKAFMQMGHNFNDRVES